MVNTTHITLRLSKEKGHQQLREGLKHTRQILAEDMSRVARAMKALFEETKRREKMRARRWAMTDVEDEMKWTASASTEWLQAALQVVGHNPPPGFSWTSHNLRKGAASATNAIKVPLNDISYAGGWSKNYTVM